MRDILSDVNELQNVPTVILEDNQRLLKITENTQVLDRCQHVSRQANGLRESIQHKIIELKYVASKENPADIFMKAVHETELMKTYKRLFDSGYQNKGE